MKGIFLRKTISLSCLGNHLIWSGFITNTEFKGLIHCMLSDLNLTYRHIFRFLRVAWDSPPECTHTVVGDRFPDSHVRRHTEIEMSFSITNDWYLIHIFFLGGGWVGVFLEGGGVRAKVKKCRIVWYWVITVFGLKDVKWKKFSGLNDLMEKERLKGW